MDVEIKVAIIAGLVTFAAAVIAYFLERRREHKLKELEFRLDRYKDFLAAFAEIGSGYKTHEAHLKLANAVNSMNLIASRPVLNHVYSLIDYVQSHRGPSYSVAEQDEIIRQIILAIRDDLGQDTSAFRDFSFRTISPGTRPGEVVER